MIFVEGEQALSAWMAENAYVSWVVRDRPWELETELIATLDLPLNLQGNPLNLFTPCWQECALSASPRPKPCPWCPIPVPEADARREHQCTDSSRRAVSQSGSC
jgi:GIY-YIG catalytic domain